MTWFSAFLFVHVLGAIIAFGPSFAMPIIGAMGGKEPMHRNFGLRVSEAISEQRIFPLAILQGITGVALIVVGGINLFAKAWLLAGIGLYLIAIGYAMFVQTPAVKRLIELTSGGPPPAGPPPAEAPAGAPAEGPAGAPAGAPAGPPPHVVAAVQKVQRGGMLLATLITLIVFLMVVKPFV